MFIVREPLAFLADRMLVYDQIIIPADFNAIQCLEADVASRYFAGNLRLAWTRCASQAWTSASIQPTQCDVMCTRCGKSSS